MATYLPQHVWGDGANISDRDRDKYFETEGEGKYTRYKLKDGYEARSLGRGEKPSKINSLTTYTNDFDSLHDEYDPKSDRENFGIFKTYPRSASAEPAPASTPNPTQPSSDPTQPSSELVAARGRWDDFERRRGEGSIHFNPTGDGIGDAADYGNRATDDYVNRFVPHLNAQANLESHEMGGSGNYHMNHFEGEPTELASSDIKDLYKHYSQQIQGIA